MRAKAMIFLTQARLVEEMAALELERQGLGGMISGVGYMDAVYEEDEAGANGGENVSFLGADKDDQDNDDGDDDVENEVAGQKHNSQFHSTSKSHSNAGGLAKASVVSQTAFLSSDSMYVAPDPNASIGDPVSPSPSASSDSALKHTASSPIWSSMSPAAVFGSLPSDSAMAGGAGGATNNTPAFASSSLHQRLLSNGPSSSAATTAATIVSGLRSRPRAFHHHPMSPRTPRASFRGLAPAQLVIPASNIVSGSSSPLPPSASLLASPLPFGRPVNEPPLFNSVAAASSILHRTLQTPRLSLRSPAFSASSPAFAPASLLPDSWIAGGSSTIGAPALPPPPAETEEVEYVDISEFPEAEPVPGMIILKLTGALNFATIGRIQVICHFYWSFIRGWVDFHVCLFDLLSGFVSAVAAVW